MELHMTIFHQSFSDVSHTAEINATFTVQDGALVVSWLQFSIDIFPGLPGVSSVTKDKVQQTLSYLTSKLSYILLQNFFILKIWRNCAGIVNKVFAQQINSTNCY